VAATSYFWSGIGRRQVLPDLERCPNRQQEIPFQHGDQQAFRTNKGTRRHLPTKRKVPSLRGVLVLLITCNVVFTSIWTRRIFDGNIDLEERRVDGGGGRGLVAPQEQQLPFTSPFRVLVEQNRGDGGAGRRATGRILITEEDLPPQLLLHSAIVRWSPHCWSSNSSNNNDIPHHHGGIRMRMVIRRPELTTMIIMLQ
jgi:hypothetical protein